MKSTLLILLALSACTCCTSSPSQEKLPALPESPLITGQVVTELDPRIWCIHQDQTGNYWFGSNGNGVYHFDGKQLVQYTRDEGLHGNQVRDIEEDDDGNIFVGTFTGVSKFDGQGFTRLQIVEPSSPEKGWALSPKDVWLLCDAGQNGVLRYDGEKLWRLRLPSNPAAEAFRAQFPGAPYSASGVYSIAKDRRGHVWMGTANAGIYRYDGQTLAWMYEEKLTTTPSGGAFGIRSIFEDRSGAFWICNTRQRFQIALGAKQTPEHSLLQYKSVVGLPSSQTDTANHFSFFLCMLEDQEGALWMACGSNGAWKFDGKTVTHYPIAEGAYAYSIYNDQQEQIWVGTLDHGVYRLNGDAFQRFGPTSIPAYR
ncbi:MAG: hypothetical protein JKY61_10465 [Planctomycetes bacterium]|nr:hypothetical protein [Planctomycetota bacterium]